VPGPVQIYAGFTRSTDTVTFLPRKTIWNVLSVRTAVWWIHGAAHGVLPQKDVGRIPEGLSFRVMVGSSTHLPCVALLSLDGIKAGLRRVALLFLLLQRNHDTIKPSPNLGVLAGLAGSGPSAALFLNGWAHKALGDKLSRCLSSRVAVGVKYPTAERR